MFANSQDLIELFILLKHDADQTEEQLFPKAWIRFCLKLPWRNLMRNETLMFVAGALIATCTTVGAYAQGGQTCATAVTISDGVTAYNNAGATVDMDYTGLCDMGAFGTDTNFHTVWFKWTATTTDTYTISTCGTAGGVDTRLSAQTGCAASTVVACNDDGVGCAGFSSIMTLSASAGTVYYIAV
ncbi:MAG: hypothetical protein EBY29_05325, partial [Planctomycetes bacterium]|nr:hypothetical protein [Planctomycetota bacterium]